MPGQEKVTYVKMTPDMVAAIVAEHIVNGRAVHGIHHRRGGRRISN